MLNLANAPRNSILRRKRRKKRLMKYKEALQALKAYQNSKLRLIRVIDNQLNPNKSISSKCQVPHCGKSIRYEYLLENKETGEKIVAGSTCVWELLNLSEQKIKDFRKIEKTIKNFHKVIEWRRKNEDVYNKLMKLKKNNVTKFREFWEEIEYCPLCDFDTEYIRNLDIDKEIEKHNKKLKGKNFKKNIPNISGEDDDNYEKVINSLNELLKEYPNNKFYKSLKEQSLEKVLTKKQIWCIKKGMNKLYFEKYVKNDPKKLSIYAASDYKMFDLFRENVKNRKIRLYIEDLKKLNKGKTRELIIKYKKQIDKVLGNNPYWQMYRLKYNIFVK